MKDIIKITISLTGVCIAAAVILGIVYAKTEHLRKSHEVKEKKETIESLLGLGHGHDGAQDVKVYPVYRYVVQHKEKGTVLGYVLPIKDNKAVIAQIDLQGKPVGVVPLKGDASKLADAGARDSIVAASLPDAKGVTYAETFYVADEGAKRKGYVLPGATQGFKTVIRIMVSLDPKFTVTGVAITESEEDPGLGDEIKKDYFKNQFIGKTATVLKHLKVVKEPLPSDYIDVLEPERTKKLHLSKEKVAEIKKKYEKKNIYALTGATISSVAVNKGVKDTVRKFVYRFKILTDAIEQNKIQVAFGG